ncbi:MAG: PDZ domain-containing protein, partial [Pseudobutyrivibrio sp.]|nr:PDZ domain-containing protein [Pseudobutyrivibrio sp.]
MLNSSHKIAQVAERSPAENAGLKPGDIITKINNAELVDIFDYHYYSDDANITVELLHEDGTTNTVLVEKEEGEDLGVIFCNGLMDDYKSCSNKCAFCFIDQMPPGMRDTLYFKDDDTRLSFLQGNYVTLTNMKMADLDRIIAYKLGPINISVHATNPELRVKLLHNRFAGDILEKINKLYDAEIPMNAQVVACPGLNDCKELDRTISDLLQFAPVMSSMSVVPVGVTKFRDGLFPLRTYTKEEAGKVI